MRRCKVSLSLHASHPACQPLSSRRCPDTPPRPRIKQLSLLRCGACPTLTVHDDAHRLAISFVRVQPAKCLPNYFRALCSDVHSLFLPQDMRGMWLNPTPSPPITRPDVVAHVFQFPKSPRNFTEYSTSDPCSAQPRLRSLAKPPESEHDLFLLLSSPEEELGADAGFQPLRRPGGRWEDTTLAVV